MNAALYHMERSSMLMYLVKTFELAQRLPVFSQSNFTSSAKIDSSKVRSRLFGTSNSHKTVNVGKSRQVNSTNGNTQSEMARREVNQCTKEKCVICMLRIHGAHLFKQYCEIWAKK